jgi:hypothetical protein
MSSGVVERRAHDPHNWGLIDGGEFIGLRFPPTSEVLRTVVPGLVSSLKVPQNETAFSPFGVLKG